jgi:hypothetical protein
VEEATSEDATEESSDTKDSTKLSHLLFLRERFKYVPEDSIEQRSFT